MEISSVTTTSLVSGNGKIGLDPVPVVTPPPGDGKIGLNGTSQLSDTTTDGKIGLTPPSTPGIGEALDITA